MGVDRYSDNHKIIVNNGEGNLEIDVSAFQLDSDVAQLSAGTLQINSDTMQINSDTFQLITDNYQISSNESVTFSATQDISLSATHDIVIQASNDFDGIIGDDFNLNVTNEFNINADDIHLETEDDFFIDVGDDLNIAVQNNINIDTEDINLTVSGSINFGGEIITPNDGGLTISGSNGGDAVGNAYILTVENTAADDDADVLKLSIPNVSIDWSDNGSPSVATSPSIGGANNFIAFWANGVKIAEIEGVWDQGDSDLQQTGGSGSTYSGVRFINGNPSDFAEWLEIYQAEEWGFSVELLEKIKSFKKKILPIPEGTVVYVRDKKIHKSSPGTPMVVSHRAAFVGNSSRIHKDFGIIVSFCGQVPVLTSGPANDGDYLLPVDGENYCIAVSKNDITFNDYKRVVGTCWESNQSSDLKKVNCAIGIK